MREHILYPLLFQIDEGTCGYQIKRCYFLIPILVIQLQNHLLTAGELILVSYATSKLDSFPSSVGIEVYELETSHEYIVLSKVVFLGNFLKKFKSLFIYVCKVDTRCFNKISINQPPGLPDFGLSFKSLVKWS